MAHKKQAISYAAYRALVDLFPSQVTTFATLMRQLGYNPQVKIEQGIPMFVEWFQSVR